MHNSGPPALGSCSIPLSAFEGKRRRTGSRDTGNPHRSVPYADRERTQWERPGLGTPGKWQWSRPRDVASLSDAEVNNRGNLIDCGQNFRLNEFAPRTKHRRSTRTKKSSEHSVGVENAHHIGPYPATRVSPETPRDRSDSAWPDFVANSSGPEGKHGQNPVSGRTRALHLLELSQSHRSEHDRKAQEGRSSIFWQELASANHKQKLPRPERLECLRRADERSPPSRS